MIGSYIAENLPDFLWSFAAFVVFVLIILKAGLRPICRSLDERDARIKAQLEEAEQNFARAQTMKGDLEEQMRGAEARIAELIQEGRRNAEQVKAGIIDDGRKEVESLRNRVLREIEAARHEAVIDLRAEVAQIAVQVAGQIIDAQLDAAAHERLVSTAIDDYEARYASKAGA